MNCCLTEIQSEVDGAEISFVEPSHPPGPRSCPSCGDASRSVARRTILLMLKPSLLDRVNEGRWRFCAGADCRVVYFAEYGDVVFTADDLHVRIGAKEREDPIPLCYCFGLNEPMCAKRSLARTGALFRRRSPRWSNKACAIARRETRLASVASARRLRPSHD